MDIYELGDEYARNAGRIAYSMGRRPCDNPYKEDKQLIAAWYEGWQEAMLDITLGTGIPKETHGTKNT